MTGRPSSARLLAVDPLARFPRARTALGVTALSGAAFVFVGALVAPGDFWPHYLVAADFLLSLGLGALVFLAIQYLSKAGWSVPLRRVPEALAAAAGAGALGFVLLPFGARWIYPWAAGTLAHPLPEAKAAWLSLGPFTARGAVYLVLWLVLGRAIVAASRRQDEDGDPAHTRAAYRASAVFLVVFAVTYNLASFDWFMSIEPHWYSTVYGVYHFAGLLLGGTAAITIGTVLLRRLGPLAPYIHREHLGDLGKLLFAFSSFWAYIWFSQYLLIWYTNIPEEAAHFAARFHGPWEVLFWVNPLVNWAVPFLVLMPFAAKRNETVLLAVSVIVLAGRYLDGYLLVVPALRPAPGADLVFGAGLSAAAVALAALVFFRAFRAAPPVPLRDPLLEEGLRHGH